MATFLGPTSFLMIGLAFFVLFLCFALAFDGQVLAFDRTDCCFSYNANTGLIPPEMVAPYLLAWMKEGSPFATQWVFKVCC